MCNRDGGPGGRFEGRGNFRGGGRFGGRNQRDGGRGGGRNININMNMELLGRGRGGGRHSFTHYENNQKPLNQQQMDQPHGGSHGQ